MPFVVLATALFRRSVAQSYRRIRVAIARINAYLQEHIIGMAVLQLFNRERKSREEFEEINRQHMDAFKDTIVAYGWFYPVVEFCSSLALAAILSYGGWRVERGGITIGVVVAFFQYATRFFRPIQDLSEKYNILQSAMAASERVFKLLDSPVEITTPASAMHSGCLTGTSRHRVRSRLVRLQRRRLGAARRELPHRAGRNRRRRRPHRRGQNHDHQPAAALLRNAAGGDSRRRRRHPRRGSARTAAALRRGAAGPVSVHRTIEENIRLGTAGITPETISRQRPRR